MGSNVQAECSTCGPHDYAPTGMAISTFQTGGHVLWSVARYFCPQCRRLCTSEYLSALTLAKLVGAGVKVTEIRVPGECREWPKEGSPAKGIAVQDCEKMAKELAGLPSGGVGRPHPNPYPRS